MFCKEVLSFIILFYIFLMCISYIFICLMYCILEDYFALDKNFNAKLLLQQNKT